MRLLNTTTYDLQTELGVEKPEYAILSHTWEKEEILFEDIQHESTLDYKSKKGFSKFKHACEHAQRDGYDYIWIDTCCINKDSSAELSEAINSMFKWYEEASMCYAYISDAFTIDTPSLSSCRWFSRGWTLQELIAPNHVQFYDADWGYLGTRMSLASELAEATGIDKAVFLRGHTDVSMRGRYAGLYSCKTCATPLRDTQDVRTVLQTTNIAQRMKWASKRETTRVEDTAYCLLGIFDVNMPLLYGEGDKAFLRLQEAILKGSADHSILAFRHILPRTAVSESYAASLFAPHPSYFRDDVNKEWDPSSFSKMILSDGELRTDMLICPLSPDIASLPLFRGKYAGILDCTIGDDCLSRPAILLQATDASENPTRFRRCPAEPVLLQLEADQASDCILLDSFQVLHRVRYDPTNIRRSTLTIVTDGVSDLKPAAERLLPMRIDINPDPYVPFTTGAAYPSLVANHVSNVRNHSWGIVHFLCHDYQHFFVVWGYRVNNDEHGGVWCRLKTLPQLLFDLRMSDVGHILSLENIVDMIVEYARGRHEMAQYYGSYEHDHMVVNSPGKIPLWIRVSTKKVTFINRSAYHLKVQGNLEVRTHPLLPTVQERIYHMA